MRQTLTTLRAAVLLLVSCILAYSAIAQSPGPVPITGQTDIRHYVIYADGTGNRLPDSTQHGVRIGMNSNINGGTVGSNFYIDIGTNNNINGSVYSGNRIRIDSGNTVNGNLVVRNDFGSTAPALQVFGGGNKLGVIDPPNGGLILSRGFVRIAPNNTVRGPVRMQIPYNYDGPVPVADSVYDLPQVDMPLMPQLPTPVDFPASGRTSITATQSIKPGSFHEIALTGGATVTFTSPGTYVFWAIRNTGINKFDFLIPSGSTGIYKIYVHGDIDLGSLQVNVNGLAPTSTSVPEAGNIYLEVHGTGDTQNGDAFVVRGITGPASAGWLGTVYAPNGRIRLGAGGNLMVNGAFWSKQQVVVGNSAEVNYQPLVNAAVVFIDPYYPPPPDGKVDTNNDKIGAELYSLSTTQDPGTPVGGDNDIFQIEGDKVWIEVVAIQGSKETLLATLKQKGLTNLVQNEPGSLVITGLFPIDSLSTLNNLTTIDYARPLYEPVTKSGAVQSEGVQTMKADLTAAGFPLVKGEGMKIGVISDSYDRSSTTILYAPLDIAAGELPGPGNAQNAEPVQVVLDFPYGLKSDEGRAMLQIVHDVAPKAKLAFRTGFISAGDFANGVLQLADPTLPGGKCHVIVDDVSYITEPFFTDGVIARAVDTATSRGVTYVTSAGNFGARSYEARFTPTSVPGVSGQAHSFGADGAYQPLSLKAGTYTIVLQWEDQFYSLGGSGNTGANTDLDIYITDAAGNVLFGFNRDNIGLDPYEVLPFVANSDIEGRLLIVKAGSRTGATDNFRLKYIIFRGNALIRNNSGVTSTIVGQANAKGAISVGAILYKNPLQIPGYPVETLPSDFSYPSVASFSSRGGTVISGEASDRRKPDLVAPNGVNTTVPLGTNDIDGDGRINFFGTSASAPHVAALAALLIQAKKTYDNEDIMPAHVRTLLTASATSLTGLVEHNTVSGFGLTDADSAMRTFANPKPGLYTLHSIDPLNPLVLQPVPADPGTEFALAAKGINFTAQTKIFIDGVEKTTTFINHELVYTRVAVTNPTTVRIKVVTPAKGEAGIDGGESNELVGLYTTPKKRVDIRVNNASRRYGEANPAFSATVTVDGAPVPEAQWAALKLNDTTYFTTATSTSPAYVYPITVNIVFDPVADAALLRDYQYNFYPGALTVGKLPVKITPADITFTEGEYPVISHTYSFGGVTLDPASHIEDSTKAAYEAQVPANSLIVMRGYSTANPPFLVTDFLNKSFMTSYQSYRRARKFILADRDLVPAPPTPTTEQLPLQRFLIDVSAQSLNNYKSTPYQLIFTQAFTGGPNRGIANSRDMGQGLVTTLTSGQLMTISNGQLMTISNGQLMTISNGVFVEVENGWAEVLSIKIYETGEVEATLSNGSTMIITEQQLVVISNGQLMTISNGQLMTISNGQLMTISNGQLMTISNGTLFIVVNGEIQFVDYVQVSADGEAQLYYNNALHPFTNGQLMTISNGQLMTISNGQLMTISNGQLMTISNGEQLLALSNGQLMTISNNLSVGSGSSNTGALVVLDEADATVQEGYLGGMFPVNMITGMERGTHRILAGTFINDNYDISYGMGTAIVHPLPLVTLTASDPQPLYGKVKVKAGFNNDALNLQWHYTIPSDSVTANLPDSIAVTNATPAVYPVYLTYKNSAGRAFKSPTAYAVFYDPNFGFVTGGGSINSPVFPDLYYMQVPGPAAFGFVSKYVKGKTEPTGNTQFEFQAGGLYFKSTSYQWLVVSGARAQFKGVGTINGNGNYGFILTATDGALLGAAQPDRFRIKIWELNTNKILYDNMAGAGDNDDLASSENTRLSSGSVTIHTVSTKKTTTTTSRDASLQEDNYSGPLKVTATPNPSSSYFILTLQSGNAKPIAITVTDFMGRGVERRSAVAANGTVRLGDRYESGIYLVEVVQGSERRLVRLVKANK